MIDSLSLIVAITSSNVLRVLRPIVMIFAVVILLSYIATIVGFISLIFIENDSELSFYVSLISLGAGIVSFLGTVWSLYLLRSLGIIGGTKSEVSEIKRLQKENEDLRKEIG